MKKEKTDRLYKKSSFLIGLIALCLAGVGLYYLITLGLGAVKKTADDSSLKKEYQTFLTPIIMTDPEIFDDIKNASMEELLNAALISVMRSEDFNPDKYDFIEGSVSGLALPESVVDEEFSRLFGPEAVPVHQTVNGSTCVFEYQYSAKRYIIPITGYDPSYLPRVINIDNSENGKTILIVGCVAYGDWEQGDEGFAQPEPAKYRRITLTNTKEGYYISAFQNADTNEYSTAFKTEASKDNSK